MAASMKALTAAPVLPQRRSVRAAAVKQEAQAGTSSTSKKAEEIYIGFPKGDYARPPGRKGRVIRDDPRKYPGKEDLGFFQGAVGGWAGGEASLWELREQIKAEESKKSGSTSTRPLAPSSPLRPPQKNKWGVKNTASGKDAIYVGFGKEELDLKKSGAQGRVIFDEAYKYPDKEDIGFLKGAVGGFAGGESVLKDFAENGELRLRKPGDPVIRKQFSPLTLAFLVIFAAAGGGIVLTSVLELGDSGVQEIVQAPIDDTTRRMLLLAVGLVGSATVIGVTRALVSSLSKRLAGAAEGAYAMAQRFVISAAFFTVVFLTARAILESP